MKIHNLNNTTLELLEAILTITNSYVVCPNYVNIEVLDSGKTRKYDIAFHNIDYKNIKNHLLDNFIELNLELTKDNIINSNIYYQDVGDYKLKVEKGYFRYLLSNKETSYNIVKCNSIRFNIINSLEEINNIITNIHQDEISSIVISVEVKKVFMSYYGNNIKNIHTFIAVNLEEPKSIVTGFIRTKSNRVYILTTLNGIHTFIESKYVSPSTKIYRLVNELYGNIEYPRVDSGTKEIVKF